MTFRSKFSGYLGRGFGKNLSEKSLPSSLHPLILLRQWTHPSHFTQHVTFKNGFLINEILYFLGGLKILIFAGHLSYTWPRGWPLTDQTNTTYLLSTSQATVSGTVWKEQLDLWPWVVVFCNTCKYFYAPFPIVHRKLLFQPTCTSTLNFKFNTKISPV